MKRCYQRHGRSIQQGPPPTGPPTICSEIRPVRCHSLTSVSHPCTIIGVWGSTCVHPAPQMHMFSTDNAAQSAPRNFCQVPLHTHSDVRVANIARRFPWAPPSMKTPTCMSVYTCIHTYGYQNKHMAVEMYTDRRLTGHTRETHPHIYAHKHMHTIRNWPRSYTAIKK